MLERAQLAAVFLAHWVDPAELFVDGRCDARIKKALLLADRVAKISATPTEIATPKTPVVQEPS